MKLRKVTLSQLKVKQDKCSSFQRRHGQMDFIIFYITCFFTFDVLGVFFSKCSGLKVLSKKASSFFLLFNYDVFSPSHPPSSFTV